MYKNDFCNALHSSYHRFNVVWAFTLRYVKIEYEQKKFVCLFDVWMIFSICFVSFFPIKLN